MLSQHSNYDNLWQRVETSELEGLPKSALKAVNAIEQQAIKDNNQIQLIKTLLFKSKFALVLEEDAQLKVINDFKSRIEQSQPPIKNVLEHLLANLYWQYFSQNRYKFYNRTKTAQKVDLVDFRTWDLQTLYNEVHLRYTNALNNGLLLQLEPLERYTPLLNTVENSKLYRPTLFDYISHNALTFYKTNETHITKPAYKFEIDTPDYLATAKTFSRLNIQSKDSTSLQLQALKIYQNLINFHLKDTNAAALTLVNIERLKYINTHAVFNAKETIFLNTLKADKNALKQDEHSALYDFEIASTYYNQSKNYQPKTAPKHRWKAKEALTLCENTIKAYPNSLTAKNCAVLKQQILAEDCHITAENFIPTQQHTKALVRYKNIDSLQFKAYKLNEKQFKTYQETYNKKDKWLFLSKLAPTASWETHLKNEDDYQIHTTEVLIPKLSNGRYVISATNKATIKAFYGFAIVQATNMAIVESNTNMYKSFQCIERTHGKPIANATVKLSYQSGYRGHAKTQEYTTDALGFIKIKKNKHSLSNCLLKVQAKDQTAYFGKYWISGRYNTSKKEHTYKSFIFTDRSIYRPGQTVYFKAIAIQTETQSSRVLENEAVHATLYNTNGETIKQLKLETNSHGSVSGTFILPNNGLNGRYSIVFNNAKNNMYSSQYISVEEYKRPKFEAKFSPITETFKINDSVTVKGNATAFSGSNISNAKVIYRVHRKVQYPRWYYWRSAPFSGEQQEITHGESTTNAKGEFAITFKALPDQSIDKNNLPIFKYEVSATVTDINGETRDAKTIINVGYHALIANINSEERIDKNRNDNTINISTTNLNGEFTPAKGSIKIYKLKAPVTPLRPRPWAAPDYQKFSKDAYSELFPNEAYGNEDKAENWERGALVYNKNFDTGKTKTLELGKLKKWASGQYIVLLESTDKFGQAVTDKTKIALYSSKDKTLADKQIFNISTHKNSYTVGETVQITLASAAKALWVTLAIEKQNKIVDTQIIVLTTNKNTINIPVMPNDVGGFVVHYSFAAFNSSTSGSLNIAVPYPESDLTITSETFRDRIKPGSDETWRFNIKGPKGEKVSAELLASMYDASLNQFKPHSWNFNPLYRPTYYASYQLNTNRSFGTSYFTMHDINTNFSNFTSPEFDSWNWFGLHLTHIRNFNNVAASRNIFNETETLSFSENDVVAETVQGRLSGVTISNNRKKAKASRVASEAYDYGEALNLRKEAIAESSKTTEHTEPSSNPNNETNINAIKTRKNFQETAFFFPHLNTDKNGNVSFSFTTPEALTQWKLQLLAHTKTLNSATKTLTTVTQKELMVIPNTPRFLREGDQITISSKIANLTDKNLSGEALLILTDALTGNTIDTVLGNTSNKKPFTVNAKENTQVSWQLSIPENIQAVQYKVIAKTEAFSDGEQNALPVLSNRMLVTETLPLWVKGNSSKTMTLQKLKYTNSSTLKHHKLTLELTSNPAWYAVQALPYLMEYPYECNEQTFSRYYANALASHIVNANPKIKAVFEQWRSSEALLSNLEKNNELKSILIQETPWLRDAQSETEQKKRIALLFDLNTMNNALQFTLNKLKSNQTASGAWPWFKGGRDNRWITQHIITGFGHLKHLNVTSNGDKTSKMTQKALQYLDDAFIKTYNDLKRYNPDIDLKKDHLNYMQLHYLYMRSFFPQIKLSKEGEIIRAYYLSQIKKYWLKRSLYAKGLMALIAHRQGDTVTAGKILKSLKETSITSDELGMYWKANTNSWFWYQAPIETQALLIEAFSEIENDTNTVDNLKIWLLKHKQTNRWKTTKATTEAVYATLLQGSDWLSITNMVDVVVGNKTITPSAIENTAVEAGTGYFKTSWSGAEITPEMGTIKLSKKSDGIAWGGLYWQYFEDLDRITSAETPLKLKKQLFLKTYTDTGETLTAITPQTVLQVGDRISVRIKLRSDRPMEFVHMKDMRASGLEPINVLSQYKWQDGLGYYESTKDASTNFFFDNLPKGVYVFEYDLSVNNAGHMSNGITTIQSMYAPEFSSHSKGSRISIN